MAFSTLFRALVCSNNINTAKIIHCKLIVSGLLPDVITSNHLMSMYAKQGLLHHARCLFDQMPHWNVVSCSILINAYAKIGSSTEAIDCFRSMVSNSLEPNSFTYVGVLSACGSLGAVNASKEIHGRIYRFEIVSNSYLSNSLVNSYSKCGLVSSARKVFDEMRQPNLVSWSSMIAGYSHSGEHAEALAIFSRARRNCTMLNEFVLNGVVTACSGLGELKAAGQAHCLVFKSGHLFDLFLGSSIINMYSHMGDLESAFTAFADLENPGLASSAAIIKAYAAEGHGERAMVFFRKLHGTGLIPNEHALSSILVGCSAACMVEAGMQIHALIIKLGHELYAYVGNTLTHFYSKCGMLRESSQAFDLMKERDVVSWNAIIAARIREGDLNGAIELVKEMMLRGEEANICTYSTLLSLCADLPTVRWGLATHCRVLKLDFEDNVVVGSALIDMYGKCGWLNNARQVFDRMPKRNLVAWNSMVVGYAQHGFGVEAVEMFDRMEMEDIQPNDVTFIGVLSACIHGGLVEKGEKYFEVMKTRGIMPRVEHYACMVDLLARAGQTKRAYGLIKSMPMEPNAVIWRSLLARCKTHDDLEVGQLAVHQLLMADPGDASVRAMESFFRANAGLWVYKDKFRCQQKKAMVKVPGRSWIEVMGSKSFAPQISKRNHEYTLNLIGCLSKT